MIENIQKYYGQERKQKTTDEGMTLEYAGQYQQ
jgi:hypothetical protein